MTREQLEELVKLRLQGQLDRRARALNAAIQTALASQGGGITPGRRRELSREASEQLAESIDALIPELELALSHWTGRPADFAAIAQPVLTAEIARAANEWTAAARGNIQSPADVREISWIHAEAGQLAVNLAARVARELRAMQLSEEARQAKARETARPLDAEAVDELKRMVERLIDLTETADTAAALRALDDRAAKTHAEVSYIADVLMTEQAKELRPNIERLKKLAESGASVLLEALVSRVLSGTL
jgi:hypothetical protein